jgi:CheY-like chemotaxis protein
VIVNLVVNAGDAMPDGGRLTITTTDVEFGENDYRLHPGGHRALGRYAVLEIADTGVGMDEHTLNHIFEPFFTTKGEGHGTGLGLATVYGIVRQSGGFVWAYSEPGRGTSFKVYLPLVTAQAADEPKSTQPASLTVAGHTVLLVEDDAAVRSIVRSMLELHGFVILEAAAGDEALALSNAEEPDSLDVLVTDTIVPGPGGVELANRVRQRHPSLRTLIMSGYADPTTGGEQLGAATEFIAKPFGTADLQAKLAALLGSAG